MNKKLHCLYTLADHAIGASNAVGAGTLAEFSGLTLNECAAYLNLLHNEKSVIRTERTFKDRAGRNCTRYAYFIDPKADIEQILSKSEEISRRGKFQPKEAPVEKKTCALAEVW